MTPSIAATSGNKARMFEATDGRVRADPLGARSTGELRQQDVAETVMSARNGFGYFPRKESNPLASEASGIKTGMSSGKAKSGFRIAPAARACPE
jgi:hypothetical protein